MENNPVKLSKSQEVGVKVNKLRIEQDISLHELSEATKMPLSRLIKLVDGDKSVSLSMHEVEAFSRVLSVSSITLLHDF